MTATESAPAEKIMLLNAIHEEELRVAIISDGRLLDCDFERPRRKQHKGDIIYAEIKHIEPSLDAAFVDIGSPTQRHGFLPFKEVASEYYINQAEASAAAKSEAAAETAEGDEDNSDDNRPARPPIKDVLKEGQRVIVQIDKDERGKKGAALTTYISLAGCYLVLMPNNPRAGGISRRVNPDDREIIKDILDQLTIPEGMGLIVRTAGVGRNLDELQWDLDILLKQWETIKNTVAENRHAPYLIHQESDIIIRTIRDYLRPDVAQIIIDDAEMYEKVKKQIELLRPDYANRVKLYSDTVALFTRYEVEKQIETAFQREVRLPSGGAVVIDHTEALTSIDVNSSRSTGGGDIEETALHTNLEAAQAIATQLRLRDLGGLIVVDFIDMTPIKNQREVERYFYDCLKSDKARVQMGRISRFGLLEMSRQRLRPSIEESNQVMCPRCNGQGLIRSVESLSLSIMRFIEEEAMKPSPVGIKPKIYAYVPTDVATYLLNEKRDDLASIDSRYDVTVLTIPNPNFETPHYHIERVIDPNKVKRKASYQLIENKEIDKSQLEKLGEPPTQILEPVVKATEMAPTTQQPKVGLLKRFITSLVGDAQTSAGTRSSSSGNSSSRRHGNRQGGQGGDRRRHGQKGRGRGGQQRHGQGNQNNRRGGGRHQSSNRGHQDKPQFEANKDDFKSFDAKGQTDTQPDNIGNRIEDAERPQNNRGGRGGHRASGGGGNRGGRGRGRGGRGRGNRGNQNRNDSQNSNNGNFDDFKNDNQPMKSENFADNE